MSKELITLCVTAGSIGFIHTIFGPDHYIPFIAMKKARDWSMKKTAVITFLCGIGHVLSSVVIGALGVIFGIAIMRLEALEAFRGNLAAWALIGFGLAYCIWGVRRAIRYQPHTHGHEHAESRDHTHQHVHVGRHSHVHTGKNITPWVLFTIFVLGPCEPLIPILMYPAAKQSLTGLILVTAVFGTITVLTMLAMVIALSFGINLVPLGRLERYTHALAGAVIFLSGAAIQFLGL